MGFQTGCKISECKYGYLYQCRNRCIRNNAVAMMTISISDEMVNLMNWGVEGETYTETDETKTFVG